MCGRYVLDTRSPWEEPYAGYFEYLAGLPARFNIAPQQGEPKNYVPIFRQGREGALELAMVQWWLLPYWSKTPRIKYTTFNARAEEVAGKPAFRAPLRMRRCLVPATGWYEWEEMPRPPNLPWYIHPERGRVVMFAGLWERWKSEDAVVESCSIIVTAPNAKIGAFHDRMPVILEPKDHELWLDRKVTEAEAVLPLLRSAPDESVSMHRVSTRVNNARNESPDLIEPVATPAVSK